MPVLTGTIADVVGSALVAGQVRRAFVRAPAARASLASGDRLIVPDPVPVDAAGPVSLELEPGPAVLVVDTFAGGPSIYELYVTADMTLLSEAVAEVGGVVDRSWVESVMVQLRADAAGSATAAGNSATAAAGSATAAAGSATAAGNAKTAAEDARDVALANSLTWRGAWAAGTSYLARDAVSYGGSSWRALAPSTGVTPVEGASWTVLAAKGDTGTTEWSGINSKPSTFPPSTHTHADKADLVGGQVPTSQLPGVALTKPFPVADRAAMLALTVEEGDVAVVTAGADKGTYMLSSGPSTTFSSWVKLTTPDAPVPSVNGQTGTVNLGASDVGASPTGHKHAVPADLTTTGTASSATYLRGDGSWQTPPDTTYAVPTQAEAEAGTATTARAFTAQRVAQGAIAASGKKDWQGTQAQYDALPTKDADRTYWIV